MKLIKTYPNPFFITALAIVTLTFCPVASQALQPEDYQPNFRHNFQFPTINAPATNATQALTAPFNSHMDDPVIPQQGAGYWSGAVPPTPSANDPSTTYPSGPALVPECWQSLCDKLIGDGFEREQIESLFARLGSCYTDSPMRIKVTELYKSKFLKLSTQMHNDSLNNLW